MKLILENWRQFLKEYKKKEFSEYGDTYLKYILKKNPLINNGELYYETHIGVDPEFQGQRVAGKIIMKFAGEARYALFFAKGRIINKNLITVLERLEKAYPDRVTKEEYGWTIKRCARKKVVSVFIFNEDRKILVIRRTETARWKPGYWDLPGGEVDEDEELKDAAIRETREETGLSISASALKLLPLYRSNRRIFATDESVGEQEIEFKPNPEHNVLEHDEYRWVSIEEYENISPGAAIHSGNAKMAYAELYEEPYEIPA
jgi:8-oxo-dGTP pyrophosphatase MutT (NUDIX family)